jgi:hypothetical protein
MEARMYPSTPVTEPPAPPATPPASQAPDPVTPALAPPALAPPVPTLPALAAEPDEGARDVSRLPQWAQSELAKLKDENAKRRISERTAIVTLHAYIAASHLGVLPAALLGSMAFNQVASQLDPSAADFPERLTDAINATVRANPWMAVPAPAPQAPRQPAQAVPPTSGAEFPGGTTVGARITEDQLAHMTPVEMAKAFEEGRLKHLL